MSVNHSHYEPGVRTGVLCRILQPPRKVTIKSWLFLYGDQGWGLRNWTKQSIVIYFFNDWIKVDMKLTFSEEEVFWLSTVWSSNLVWTSVVFGFTILAEQMNQILLSAWHSRAPALFIALIYNGRGHWGTWTRGQGVTLLTGVTPGQPTADTRHCNRRGRKGKGYYLLRCQIQKTSPKRLSRRDLLSETVQYCYKMKDCFL